MPSQWAPESAVNFRDLGGFPTACGHLRPGMLFRSASPQFLSADDAQRLVRDTPLKLVLDLRYPGESAIEGHGALAATGVRLLNVPILGVGGTRIEMQVLAGAHDQLGAHYISYVEHDPSAFASAVRALAEPDGLPALVHCAAGKDRTGVLVAVLLSALGVPDDVIVDDYARTAENLPRILGSLSTAVSYAESIELRPHDDPFAQSPPATMRHFLAWLAAEHGSARAMLLAGGLEPEALDALCDTLVLRAAA